MSVELLPVPVFAFFPREENDGASSLQHTKTKTLTCSFT